jgi:hypothetical protein
MHVQEHSQVDLKNVIGDEVNSDNEEISFLKEMDFPIKGQGEC